MAKKINNDDEKTTITVGREVKERIDDFGKKSETYDDIMTRLLNGYKG